MLLEDVAMEIHARRKANFRKGQRLSKRNCVVKWRKPICLFVKLSQWQSLGFHFPRC